MNHSNHMEPSTAINAAIWSQFGASLDTLKKAIELCPAEHWDTKLDFWYASYHCIFWTDYFLTTEPTTFEPPAPFTLSEFDASGKRPERTYTKQELMTYWQHCHQKAYQLINGLSIDTLNEPWKNKYKNSSQLEILLYNLRHIQHHAAQLNLLLRQTIDQAPDWVSKAEMP